MKRQVSIVVMIASTIEVEEIEGKPDQFYLDQAEVFDWTGGEVITLPFKGTSYLSIWGTSVTKDPVELMDELMDERLKNE